MIPPTIIIGVGGQGGAIAAAVLDRLREHAAESRDPGRMNDMIDRYVSIFAVDTKREAAHNKLRAGNIFELAPTDVDQTITRLRASNDFFQKWWPSHIERVGNFFDGAGAVRAKGRLAYWLQGAGIATQVKAQLAALRPVWSGSIGAAMSRDQPAFVFVVGSVAGGTGSGILLSLAMHLRRELTGQNVQIIGALPLASIMEDGPADFQRRYIWGNVSAALREIDWWQFDGRRPRSIAPFFPLHGESSVTHDAQERPFDLVYLFTKSNRNGKSLPDFGSYSRLIADCLALDISSPVTESNRSSFSNFIGLVLMRHPVETPAGKRPIVYGSVGSASITYPVRDISRHLGLRLVTNLLERDFLTPDSRDTEAIEWVNQQRLEERGNRNDLFDALQEPLPDVTGGSGKQLKAAPSPMNQLEGARKADVAEIVRSTRKRVENDWLAQVEEHAEANLIRILEAQRTALREKILGYLSGTDSEGYEKATETAAAIGRVLRAHRDDVREELLGDGASRKGKRLELERIEGRYKARVTGKNEQPGVVQALEDGYGGFSLRPGKAAEGARESFIRAWWNPWIELKRHEVLAQRVLRIYDALIETVDEFEHSLHDITASLQRKRAELLSEGQRSLGSRRDGAALVLEDRVLDHPVLAERLFARRLNIELQNGAGIARNAVRAMKDLVISLETSTIRSDSARVRKVDEAVDAAFTRAVEEASRVFHDEVAGLSVWDALVEEHRLRTELDMWDELIASVGGRLDVSTYIQQRVEQCVARSVPFWRLDDATLAQYPEGKPARDGGLFVSRDAVAKCTAVPNLGDTLKSIAQQVGLNVQYMELSDHRLVVSQREGGTPLFAIDGSEIARMIDGEAQVTHSSRGERRHLYIDQRYAAALPPDLTISSAVAGTDEASTLVGLGVQLGVVRYGGTAERPNRGAIEWAVDSHRRVWEPLGPGIVRSLERLATNDADRDLLKARVDRELQKVPRDQHVRIYDQAIEWSEGERDRMPKDKNGISDARRDAYAAMVAALRSGRRDL